MIDKTIDKGVEVVKGLTLQNVLVMAMLFLMAAPAWLAWRVVNDEALLGMIFSNFREVPMPGSDCAMRIASERGRPPSFYISNSLAYHGSDRYYIGVNTIAEPDDNRARELCQFLSDVIHYVVYRDGPPPKFPQSDRDLFHHLPDERPDPTAKPTKGAKP